MISIKYFSKENSLITLQRKRIFIHSFFGMILCLIISTLLAILSDLHAHWFMVPITLCALLLIPEIVKWITGRFNLYDPLAIIALLGIIFFYINPILHVYLDVWMRYVPPPNDWRPWLGYMGFLNFLGLVLYKIITSKYINRRVALKTYWVIKKDSSLLLIIFAIVFSVSLQIYVFSKFGGIRGFAETYTSQRNAFAGMGLVFLLSESFPILIALLFTLFCQKYKTFRQWPIITIVFGCIIIITFVSVGLRGSRSNFIWQCFWFAGMIHFGIRPLNKKLIACALVFLYTLMYVYGAYKSYGIDAVKIFSDRDNLRQMAVDSGRTPGMTMLGDLGRSDVQAYVLYLLSSNVIDYRYKYGETYLNAFSLIIPKPIRPKFYDKAEAGFELLTGLHSTGRKATRIYGLAGESMLNFGPAIVPIAFAIFAWLVSICRIFMMSLKISDSRILFVPFVINALILLLVSDLDNLIFFLIKTGSFPLLILWIISHKYREKKC